MGGEVGPLVVEAQPLVADGGNSGAVIERVTLADGRMLIRKRVSPDDDWMARVGGDDGRLAAWWAAGVFGALPARVDSGLVSVELSPDGGWDVYMDDVSAALARPTTPVSAAERAAILGAAHDLHTTPLPDPAPASCPLVTRYTMFSASTMATERALGNHHGELIGSGWEAFVDLVAPEVADVVMALGAAPGPLVEELAAFDAGLVHGDLRLDNLGLTDEALVLIDWGERIGVAPPAVDLAWLLGFDGYRLGAPQDTVVDEILALYGAAIPPASMELTLMGATVQLGGIVGLWISRAGDGDQVTYRAHLDWLVACARTALDRHPSLAG